MKSSSKIQLLTELIGPAVQACGLVLWGVEFSPQGKRSLLRVYIDKEANTASKTKTNGTVSVDDCVKVSHQISGVLDVHDPIHGEFVLEVSSPGWDRRFFKVEQLTDYIGQTLSVRMIHAVNGRRKLTGKLIQVKLNDMQHQHSSITIAADDHMPGDEFELTVSNIDKANLVYQD